MKQETKALTAGSERFARKSERELFLDRMEQAVPWKDLMALAEPHVTPREGGEPAAELSILLRTFFAQRWFDLSDADAEDALYESPVLRHFVGVDLNAAPAPDRTAILRFRQILEEQDLDRTMTAAASRYLDEQHNRIAAGTSADAATPKAQTAQYSETAAPDEKDGAGRAAKSGILDRPNTTSRGTSLLSVAVISPDKERRNAAISALGDCHSGPIREFTSYPPNLEDVSRTLNRDFDIVIIDLDSDSEFALKLVASICTKGAATVMVYSAHAGPDLLLRSMRAGAREFLTLPFDLDTMADALLRASSLHSADRPAKKADGRLLVFLSAKGGAGVTTLACNFAVSLAQESGQRTLLIDLNLPLGGAAINLGIRAEHSIVDALQNFKRLDSNYLSTLTVEHGSGLFLLASPSQLAAIHYADDAINKLLEVACQEFDYVVVDAGAKLDQQHTRLFDKSSTIYLVTQVGLAELRNSNRLISKLSAAGSPKLEIVMNRYDPRNPEIAEEHVTKSLTRAPEWRIPNDYAAVRRMQNTATPLMEDDSEISRAILEMAQSVCGQMAIQKKKKDFGFFR